MTGICLYSTGRCSPCSSNNFCGLSKWLISMGCREDQNVPWLLHSHFLSPTCCQSDSSSVLTQRAVCPVSVWWLCLFLLFSVYANITFCTYLKPAMVSNPNRMKECGGGCSFETTSNRELCELDCLVSVTSHGEWCWRRLEWPHAYLTTIIEYHLVLKILLIYELRIHLYVFVFSEN